MSSQAKNETVVMRQGKKVHDRDRTQGGRNLPEVFLDPSQLVSQTTSQTVTTDLV